MMKPGKNIILFKNPWLERLTYVHPVVPGLLWGPVALLALWWPVGSKQMTTTEALGLAAAGLIFWTLVEYLLHRFVFHYHPPPGSPKMERFMFFIHGVHHEDPHDQRRLLMPPAASIALAVVIYTSFTMVLGATLVNPFFAGFVVGYIIYDYIHFATHFAHFHHPWFLRLKQNHLRHHFTAPTKLFGVSSTVWDYVFRTRA